MFSLQMPKAVKDAIGDDQFQVHFRNAKDDEPAELLILDDIGKNYWGEGVSASEVVNFAKDNRGKPIRVRINSFGGDAYAGLQMYNVLSSHDGPVTTINEGIAYSAASVVFLAGDVRKMHKASDFGIHRASTGAIGNRNTFQAMAEWLDTLDGHLLDVYASVSDQDRDELVAALDGTDGLLGTVYSADEALDAGFATEVIQPKNKTEKAKAAAKQAIQNRYDREMAAIRRRRVK